jgi:hypothetical protein
MIAPRLRNWEFGFDSDTLQSYLLLVTDAVL